MNYEELYAAQTAFFDAPWLKGCSFANEWRNEWRRVLRAAARDPQPYPPQNPAAVFSAVDRALYISLQQLLKLRSPAAHRYQKFRDMGLRYTVEARKDRT